MTIEELTAARKKLDRSINDLIVGFSAETWIAVREVDVSISTGGGIGGGSYWRLNDVSVRCDI